MRTKQQIEKDIEKQQKIQMCNPPSSANWIAASQEIHKLAKELTGKEPKDACGRR